MEEKVLKKILTLNFIYEFWKWRQHNCFRNVFSQGSLPESWAFSSKNHTIFIAGVTAAPSSPFTPFYKFLKAIWNKHQSRSWKGKMNYFSIFVTWKKLRQESAWNIKTGLKHVGSTTVYSNNILNWIHAEEPKLLVR